MAALRLLIMLLTWLALASACVSNMRCLLDAEDGVCPRTKFSHLQPYLYENRTDGMYKFVFNSSVSRCTFSQTKISVDFWNASEDVCADGAEDDMDSDYTNIYRMRFDDSYENCSQVYIEFCFKYLIKGCYKIYIEQSSGNGTQKRMHPPFKKIVWLQNSFTLKDFKLKPPKMGEYPQETHHNVITEFEEDYLTESFRDYKFTLRPINSSNWDNDTNCTNTTTRITCTLKNMNPGQYEGNIEIFNLRCNSMYGECSWTTPIVRDLVSNSLKYTEPIFSTIHWYEGYLTILVVLALCITSLVGWICFKKKTSKKIAAQQTYDNALCNGVNCHVPELETVTGIYLIYARDCLPFMRVMEHFRKLLRKMTGCKIYDVFDDDLFCEIAMSPNEWVMSHLQNPNIRVVLVATECANRLYKNLLYYHAQKTNPDEHYFRDVYLQPTYCDSVVTYSLKLISFDVNPFPYHKFFVVRFPKFNKDTDYMTHVNPFKRFDMPENLGALIENIFHQATLGNVDYDSDSESPCETFRKYAHITEGSFIECVKELNEFFKDNSTYLMENIMINQADISPVGDCATLLTRSQSNVA